MNKSFLFLDCFSQLLKKGYSLYEALDICYSIFHFNKIKDLQNLLLQGISIEESIMQMKFSNTFNEFFLFFQKKKNLAEAIEKSLNICKIQKEYSDKLKKELSYPFLLVLFLVIFSFFVLIVFIPKILELYSSFEITMGFIHLFFIRFFNIVPFVLLLFIFFTILFLFRLIYHLKQKNIPSIIKYLSMPFIRHYLKKYFSIRFALYYNELQKDGIDSHSIITVLNDQLCHTDIKIVVYEIKERMIDGELLEHIIQDCIYFDSLLPVFFNMFFQYANTQSLDDYIRVSLQQLETTLKRSVAVFTAFIYVFVALFVIIIYLSLVLPMMNVVSNI